MDFRPEKIFLGKHADGSDFRIEQWNYDTRAGFELIGGFLNIFSVVFLIQIMSPIILVLHLLSFNGRANVLNIIGIVLGGYFLYDAYNGWLVTSFLRILLNDSIMNILVYLNAIAVVLHVILLLFSTLIYNMIVSTFTSIDKCEQAFSILIACICFVVFIITNNILDSNTGWVDKNIKASIEKNKEPEPVQIEEPEPVYDDGYFHDNPEFLNDLK